ncbi:glycosyl transferase, UDP-glucuronosyltransferase [Rivularia sp. PCC 7116]|uniref:glycosyltransferase n=1 Tax=Rivularia sp. PCC 7116 TaxID=373994 RepID=UPI00029F20E4|nr:glycosyltransferase [Rivularia sp. PCC 7116]AFY53862.1 glycosyl transferase, UDP-glucuronosyltransferase [Rivularia sp. PCC 7116]
MHITILTLGSRGDVQPFIALGVGLKQAGYKVKIASQATFKSEISSRGLEFALISGNPKEGIESAEGQAMLRTKNPIDFVRRMGDLLEPLMEKVFLDSWQACQETDAIIGGGFPFWGFDIAEKLNIPFYYAYLTPGYPTKEFPNAVTPAHLEKLGGIYNRFSYTLTIQLFWQFFRKPINQFRESILNLPPTSIWKNVFTKMEDAKVNYLIGCSASVIPKPKDWSNRVHLTGYWFLDTPDNFTPPTDLVNFLKSGSPPVYIGFGSMAGEEAQKIAEIALLALAKTQQRGIFLSGWGSIKNSDLPDTVFQIDNIPHSWLFPKMACIVHHGGAGTTAATFRAGVPSIIIPFFGDQQFWAYQAAKLGVSPPMIDRKNLTVDSLAQAITNAVENQSIKENAASLGDKIRSENGVREVVEIFSSRNW